MIASQEKLDVGPMGGGFRVFRRATPPRPPKRESSFSTKQVELELNPCCDNAASTSAGDLGPTMLSFRNGPCMKPGKIGRVGQIYQVNRVHLHQTETNRELMMEDDARHFIVSPIINPRESVPNVALLLTIWAY